MKIGFIGASTVAQTITRHLAPLGHEIMLSNSRGPDSLASLSLVSISALYRWAGACNSRVDRSPGSGFLSQKNSGREGSRAGMAKDAEEAVDLVLLPRR